MIDIEREYRRLSESAPGKDHPMHDQFQGAKQALAWVLDPELARSPAAVLIDS